jgi:hypothetical protein
MADDRLGPIIEAAVNRLDSEASASGYFDDVLTHEPKSAPTGELTFSTWIGDIQPIALQSGLNVTSCRLEMLGRVWRNMLAEPQDTIDTVIGKATSYMLAQLTGDFGIDGAYIDLLGAHGAPLGATFGYIEADRTMFRITDIVIPFICEDVFDQEE